MTEQNSTGYPHTKPLTHPASAGNHRRPKPLSPAVSLQCSLLRKFILKGEMFILKGEMLKGIPCCHRAYTAGFIMELRGNKLMSSTQGIK